MKCSWFLSAATIYLLAGSAEARAQAVHGPAEVAPVVGLAEAAELAVELSLELEGADRRIEAAQEDVREARAELLPQAKVSTPNALVEEESVAREFGAPRERSVSGGASLTQVVFSEEARANIDIQRRLLERQEFQRQAVLLDTVLETATAYLGVLRAQTLRRVQQESLRLTQAHLETARARRDGGTAGPEDVYRWESKLSMAEKDAAAAEEQVRRAKAVLNGLLYRAPDAPLALAETGLTDPALAAGPARLFACLDSPENLDTLAGLLVREGLESSPELAQIDAAMAAQERKALAARREAYAPTIAIKGEVSQGIGKGRDPAESGLKLPLDLTPKSEDAKVDVGIRASIPLFSGGARRAAQSRATADLERLRGQRRDTMKKIEQKIRSTLAEAQAAYLEMEPARQAAESARERLDRTAEAYSQGSTTVVDLLDAQNAAIVSSQVAANTGYEFLVDWTSLQRAVARFDFLQGEDEREAWLARMERLLVRQTAAGSQPPSVN